jgi:hypothetical protein
LYDMVALRAESRSLRSLRPFCEQAAFNRDDKKIRNCWPGALSTELEFL